MTKTTTITNPGWRIQLAIHRAVRRDIKRVASSLAGSATRIEAARSYWSVAAAQLHHHHELEDSVIWPLMGERLGPSVSALLARNAQEHTVMADAMAVFAEALDIADADAAVARLELLRQAIDTHLAHEEADVLPLIPSAFTLEDLGFFQSEDAKTNDPSVFLPWMFDAAPQEDIVFFTAHIPPPVRAQLDSEWASRWRGRVDALGLTGQLAYS